MDLIQDELTAVVISPLIKATMDAPRNVLVLYQTPDSTHQVPVAVSESRTAPSSLKILSEAEEETRLPESQSTARSI